MNRRYKNGEDRTQTSLFPISLDEYLSENNPIRAIDAYVESLDMAKLGFGRTNFNATSAGQPAYAPKSLLKLYLYGYLNRIRSSRLLEKECRRNIEVMWLLRKLVPNYKTIANFRKDNGVALRKTHRDFILVCRDLALFGGEHLAVDGSFFKGNVSSKSFVTVEGLSRDIKKLDTEIEEWIAGLDKADLVEVNRETLEDDPALPEKLRKLQDKRSKKAFQLNELKMEGKSQQSHVDRDARLLNKRGQKTQGYNVQIVTDDKHHLLVADEVTTDPTDLEQLHPMASQARVTLEAERLEILADAGYYKGAQIKACLDDEITPYVPEPSRKAVTSGRFERADFQYDEKQNVYICPGQNKLKPMVNLQFQNGQWQQSYASRKTECRECLLRSKCLSSKSKNRRLLRGEYEDVLTAHAERMAAHSEKMRKRSSAVEHPFGTIKRRAGFDHFLLRGLPKVRGEWSLMALAYNFTRVLNILGVEQFIAQCRLLQSRTAF